MTPVHDPISFGCDRDVTTQETEALRPKRDLLSVALDTAGAPVVLLHRHGRIVRFSRACETRTGYSFEQTEGQVHWHLTHYRAQTGGPSNA